MSNKEWFSAAELAGLPGMPIHARVVNLWGESGKLQRRKRLVGKGWEYHISSLPTETRTYLAAEAIRAAKQTDEHAMAGGVEGRKLAIATAIDARTERRNRQVGLASFMSLNDKSKQRADAKLAILSAVDAFTRASHLPRSIALHTFCAKYNLGEIPVEEWVRANEDNVHPATLYRWRKTLKSEGAAGLAGHYGHRKGASKIDQQPALKQFVVAMLTDHPHANAAHIYKACKARFSDSPIELPSKRRLEVWVAEWKEENKQLHMAVTNPDAWKNRYMVAFGSQSEGIERLNQRWEFDSTPADVMLLDGRYSIIGVIDVYSRRPMLIVSKTSKATAIALLIRRALMTWGVPEQAKTDNGKDYTSFHIKRVFDSLAIEHLLCEPFSAWQKPHIERFFRTFSHDLLELCSGYIGHNVAERSAIEARQAFSERLFQKDATVEMRMTAAELQSFCDRWVDSIYMHNRHSELGKTPFEMATAWRGEISTIDDERALDVLLAEAPGSGQRTVGKKGISVEGINYIAPELGELVGEKVHVRFSEDVGRIYVFNEQGFVCMAESPTHTGVSRQEVAAHAKERQKVRVQAAKRALKQAARDEKTKDIAEEIIASREAATGTLVAFPPRKSIHESDGLAAALDAAVAQELNTQTPEPLQLTVDEQDRHAELIAKFAQPEPAEVISLTDDPRRNYARWLRLADRADKGGLLASAERQFLQIYPTSSEFASMKKFFETFGLTAEEFA